MAKTKNYIVTGMSCAACAARVDKAVRVLSGVDFCSVNLLTGDLIVEGDVSDITVIKAVTDAGYSVFVKSEAVQPGQENIVPIVRRLVISAVLLLLLMYLSMGAAMFGWPVFALLKDPKALWAAAAALALAVIIINRRFFINGIKAALHLSPNMDTLVAMGSGISFIYSFVWFCRFCLLTPERVPAVLTYYTDNFFFDSAAMILVFISVGKLLETAAKGRTLGAIKALYDLAPQEAVIMTEDAEKKIPLSELKVGDIMLVRPGMSFPADGIVIDGSGGVNESSLTGESLPVYKNKGDKVSAATICLDAAFVCKVTHTGADSTLGRIIKMVSDSAATKAPIARIADKVSAIFVPAVLAIALITFIVWIITGASAGTAVTRAVSVLVISCPCALGLATPVAIMVGNGIGAKHGILFKNSESLELAGRASEIVFDKTGTLTFGYSDKPDELKPDSVQAVNQLLNMGLGIHMLSGDKKEIAGRIAHACGIDDYHFGLLPGEKLSFVEHYKKTGKTIMVGDGINDAPGLTKADIGFAIGAGTDVAIESADVVLMGSGMLEVPAAIRLSRAVIRNIYENLFWAFFYNLICIPLAAGVWIPIAGISLSPMIGAAAMSLSSFCVVLNALRLNFLNIYNASRDKMIKTKYKSEDKIMTKTIRVSGMMCEHCEKHASEALMAIDGIESAAADHNADTVIIEMSREVPAEEIRKAIEAAGYKVTAIDQ